MTGSFRLLLTRALHLSKGQLVDVDGRLQTRQCDDDAGKRHWKTEVVDNGGAL
jgi:single-stranded DNA-binding protein